MSTLLVTVPDPTPCAVVPKEMWACPCSPAAGGCGRIQSALVPALDEDQRDHGALLRLRGRWAEGMGPAQTEGLTVKRACRWGV